MIGVVTFPILPSAPPSIGKQDVPDPLAVPDFAAFLRHVLCRAWDESKLVVALQSLEISAVHAIMQALGEWLRLHLENQPDALAEAGLPIEACSPR